MIVMNTDTGKMIAQFPAGGADEMFFDAPSQRIYLQGYEGLAEVWKEVDPDHYDVVGKTALFVPELNRYYNAVSQQMISVETVLGSKLVEGCIEVYEVQP